MQSHVICASPNMLNWDLTQCCAQVRYDKRLGNYLSSIASASSSGKTRHTRILGSSPRFHRRQSRWLDEPRQAPQPRPPGSDPRGRRCRQICNNRNPYRRNLQVAFLPACMSTSGCIHCEFLHLLFFLANKQADDYFQALGYQPHKQEFCHRRSVFFQQHRCTIGMACAQAVALRGAPTPRVATSLHLATCRPSTWPTTSSAKERHVIGVA
jgi:hypothetical protein